MKKVKYATAVECTPSSRLASPESDPTEYNHFPSLTLISIFGHMSADQVLRCAMVNRDWHDAAKSVLRKRCCAAALRDSCQRILDFDNFLKHTRTTVYNSLDIRIPEDHECSSWADWPSAIKFCRYSRALPLRSLTLGANSCRFATRLMSCILYGVRETLEELRLVYTFRKGKSYVGNFFDKKWTVVLPKLRVIEATTSRGEFGVSWFDLAQVINGAPSLVEVNAIAFLDDTTSLSNEKLKTLTKVICSPYEDLNSQFLSLVEAQPRLRQLYIRDEDKETLIPPAWSTSLQTLLVHCQTSLQRLSICAVELLKYLSSPAASPLSALDHLEIYISENSFIQYFEHALVVIQESSETILPAWKSLRAHFGPPCFHDVLNDIDFQSVTEGNSNVTDVVLKDPPCVVSMLEICLDAFPAISSLAFQIISCTHDCGYADEAGYIHMDELAALLPEFSSLKRLKIGICSLDWAPKESNLDSLFCGISYEEVEQLRLHLKTKRFSLRGWQYCPVQVPLLQLPSLQELCLVFPRSYKFKDFPITKVSCGIAFARNHHVKVSVDSHSDTDSITKELRLLRHYAEIRYITDGRNWW